MYKSSSNSHLSEARADILVDVVLKACSVSGHILEVGGVRVSPARVVELSLPGPEYPTRHARRLIQLLLSSEPLLEEVAIVPVNVGGHAPFASDVKVLAANDTGVSASTMHELVLIATLAVGEAEADVVVVVKADVGVVGDGAVVAGTAGIPLGGHELDVELLVVGDAELGLGITDGLEGSGVVLLDQAGVLTGRGVAAVGVVAGDGLVEDLDHADGAVGIVGVDAVRHPGHPLLGATEVAVVVEAGWVVVLASEDVLLLATGSAVEIDDNIDAQVSSLADNSVEIRKHAVAVGKRLAVLVHNVGVRPVSDGNADSVQTDVMDRLDSVLVNPVSPVVLKTAVALFAVAAGVVVLHAVKFGSRSCATHDIVPFVGHHPALSNEPT